MAGDRPNDWRKSLYYHYYEYSGAHQVRRHEGVATARYKLIRFYGLDVPRGEEWELYDLQRDPHEVRNEYAYPGCAAQVGELKTGLQKLRKKYELFAISQDARKHSRKNSSHAK